MELPSGQDIWNTIRKTGYANVQVSNDYAPTLINTVRCAKARENKLRKLAGLQPWCRLDNEVKADNGVMCIIRFELAVHPNLV